MWLKEYLDIRKVLLILVFGIQNVIIFELICYLGVDFGSCKIDRKNTSGKCQFLGHSFAS